jgi:6-pyruvoyltetrahydropterin/6-carboxytetrahydropterin synthase
MATMELTKRLQFAAAHRLASPALPEAEQRRLYGACVRTHGHNYTLEVTVRGPVGADGMVMDAAQLEATMRAAVVELVDHRDLDRDVPALAGIVTTGEHLACTFYRLLAEALPPGRLVRVAVVETENNRFEYTQAPGGVGTGA